MKLFDPERTIRLLLSVVVVYFVLLVGHTVFFDDFDRRPTIGRVKSDMRTMATVLEQYRLDNGTFPPCMPMRVASTDVAELEEAGGGALTTFAWSGAKAIGLTTPVQYITSYPRDSLSPRAALPLSYHPIKDTWIITSAGRDGDYDIVPVRDFDAATSQPSPRILHLTYDSTNGAKSSGDVWLIKE